MTLTTDITTPAEAAQTDRRRPGRIEQVNPSLLPMLRTDELPTLDDTIEFDEPDQVSAARGVFVGVAISAPVWIAIISIGRWLLS